MLFTVDFYTKYVEKDATELEQTQFGKKITIVLGLVCGIEAILLQGFFFYWH